MSRKKNVIPDYESVTPFLKVKLQKFLKRWLIKIRFLLYKNKTNHKM